MAKPKVVSLSDLIVNTENYRFDTVNGQKEAIDKMIVDQGDNLLNIAKHIITYGLNPNDRIQVLPSTHDKNKYIVLEGNRRTVSLKLLNNPDLMEGSRFEGLKKKFKKLAEGNREQITSVISKIDCIIYDDPKEADIWVGLKHGYGDVGVSTERWDPLQKHRFAEKTEGKTSTSIQIIKLLKTSPGVPESIKTEVEKISTTNLDRLIDDPDVRKFLGVEIDNGILQSVVDKKEVVKGLTQMVKDILDPKFNVKKIYDKTARKDYITSFPKASQPDRTNIASKPWQFNSTASTSNSSSPAPKSKPIPKDRNRLIPKNCTLTISKPKLNAIYYELRTIDVTKHTNAVAVLFRVFVELSSDCYIEHHSLASSLTAAKSGLNFQQKISTVASHLETKKFADRAICKGIRSAIKETNDLLGIDTWHAYVHNNKFAPKSKNLIITWDNIEDFMVILWNNIK